MNMTLQSNNLPSIASRFRAAPLELQAFAVFSVAITVLELTLTFLGPKSVKEAIVPIAGWSACTGYMFSIYFIFSLILIPVSQWRRMRFGVVAMLFIPMVFGIYDLFRLHGPDFGNPYLTVSPWQPLWTLGLPALWIAVLFSPRVKKFCDGRIEQKAA